MNCLIEMSRLIFIKKIVVIGTLKVNHAAGEISRQQQKMLKVKVCANGVRGKHSPQEVGEAVFTSDS